MKRLKIAHISSVHFPDDPRIAIKESGALEDAGYDVVFICPQKEAPHTPIPGRATRFVPMWKSRTGRMTRTVWSVLRAALRERADVYHFHDAELLTVAPILRLTGAAVVYDVHEDLADSIEARYWIPAPIRRLTAASAGVFQWLASSVVNGVVAATPRIATHFPPKKTVVVQNFIQPDELNVAVPTPYEARAPLFAYIGAISDVRGAREMIRALELIPPALDARLVIGGPYSEQDLIDEIKTYPGWRRVEHHPWQSRAQVATHLDRARAGLVILHPTYSYVHSYPVKMFEYLAAGIPVIVSNFDLWRELLGDVNCAIFVDPLDATALAKAMQWILEHPDEAREMGRRGRAAVLQRFSWSVEATKLVTFYDKLLPRPTLETDPHLRNA